MFDLTTEQQSWVDKIYHKVEAKLEKNATDLQNIIPYRVDENGKYTDMRYDPNYEGVTWWTNGFYAGLLWLMYEHTGKEIYKISAKKQELMLDDAFKAYDGLHHDVAFMWNLAAKPSYLFDGNHDSKVRSLMAANILAARANIKGKYIKAWNTVNYTIIDSMMNIPLLYWASREIGDDRYRYIAEMHADSTIKHHIREDGSVVHIANHYTDRDEIIETLAGQGCAVGSSWTRGQAWAVYGFALSYIHTKEQRYLDTAIKVTDKFIEEAEKFGWKIPCDFKQKSDCTYLDNSAALCAVCGMIELYKITKEDKYLQSAMKILMTLEKDLDFGEENQSIVQNCMEAYYSGVQLDLIYADFFLTEALLKLRGSEFLIW